MIQTLLPAITGITNLASEFIEDPDKKIEFEYKKQQLQNDLLITLVKQETNPWIDGAVKLLTAMVALVRPLASIGVFVYSLTNPEYLAALNAIDPTIATVAGAAAFSAAPLWGASRHKEKITKAQQGFLD